MAENGTVTPITSMTGEERPVRHLLVRADRQSALRLPDEPAERDISSYRVGPDGELTLLRGDAAHTDEVFPAVGPTILPGDLTLSRDVRYLYDRNVMDGDVNACAVGTDGHLKLIQRLDNALPNGAIGVAGS